MPRSQPLPTAAARTRPQAIAATLAALLALVPLAGCAGGPSTGRPGQVDVLASTNVWGAIAHDVGGRYVHVTSVISDPDQDPHSFEASARTLLEVKDAGLIIENGGGYDDFMTKMTSAADSTAPVINAVEVSGHRAPPGGQLNEHVWYDLRSAQKVADVIADRLSRIEPAHAAAFHAGANRFDASVQVLVRREAAARARIGGDAVGITEPVPVYMLDALGLRNLTPSAFSDAVEESSDVSVRVLHQTLSLYTNHRVKALVYNAQTSGAITSQVEAAARSAGVPIVPVTETMPLGDTYPSWMASNLTRIIAAVERG